MVSYRSQLVILCLCAALSGCQKQQQPAATTTPATTAAPAQPASAPAAAAPASAAPAAAPAGALASAQFGADPDLRCDLLEVKRVSGGALLVRWRVLNTAGSAAPGLAASQPKSIYYDFDWKDIYYIDPAENKKYNYLTDADGQKILDVFWGSVGA